MRLFEIMGRYILNVIQNLGGLCLLFFQTIRLGFGYRFRNRFFYEQLQSVGIGSMLVVLNTGAFMGMVIAVQSFYQARQFGIESGVGTAVGLSITRELGPLLTALILSGRVGASMAAELGTMRVSQQIDALYTLGVNPIRFLVVPRFWACIIMIPILTIFVDAMAIWSAYILSVKILGVVEHFYLYNMFKYVDPYDVVSGVLKSIFFGAIIAIVACNKGFYTQGGAQGVGRAAIESVVWACMLILIFDFFLSLVLF